MNKENNLNPCTIRQWNLDYFMFGFMVIFFITKIPILNIPYFWDEVGVYAAGILKMKDDGTIGVLPHNLEPLYSRGHPLFFYFSSALFLKIFGDSLWVGHLFCILLAIATLVVFYFMASSFFTKRIALISTIILAFQPIFFSLSGYLLPEMMTAFFMILAMWGLIGQRPWMYVIAASLCIMTKETGIILPAVAGICLFIQSIYQRDFFTLKRWGWFLLSIVPLLVYLLFLEIQFRQNGWYFFPEHIGYVAFALDLKHWIESFNSTGMRILYELFIHHGRFFISILALGGLILFFVKKCKMWNGKAVLFISIFLFVSMVFSFMNYFIPRYIVFMYPFVILLLVATVVTLVDLIKNNTWRYITLVSFVCCSISIAYSQYYKGDECDMSYTRNAKNIKECINWVETQPWKDSLFAADFPIFQGFLDKRYGYLEGSPLQVNSDAGKDVHYYIHYFTKEEDLHRFRYDRLMAKFDEPFSHIVVMYSSTGGFNK